MKWHKMSNATLFLPMFAILILITSFGEPPPRAIAANAIPYEIYITKAITNTNILPQTFPIPGHSGRSLTITACRGEYEPATFVIHAVTEIKHLLATASALRKGQSIIPASAIDIRVVKCWFGSGEINTYRNEGKFVLTPELLLKDDKLIQVDLSGKKNYLRTKRKGGKEKYVLISSPSSDKIMFIKPKDADVLQPVDLTPKTNKQFWITIRVPENSVPGHYEGKIKLEAANAPPVEINLTLVVLPFYLEKPALKYGVWYRGILSTPHTLEEVALIVNDGKGVLNSDYKTPQQYLAEMVNIKNHGVDFPTMRNSGINYIINGTSVVQQELSIRQSAGLTGGPLFASGASFGNPPPQTDAELQAYKAVVRKWLDVAKSYGYSDLYCYEGIDEAWDTQLTSERPAFQAIHEAGAKVFIATWWPQTFDLVGDLVDVCIYSGNPNGTLNPAEPPKWHSVGRQLLAYGTPSTDVKTPETFRRNYGIALWKAGYDGCMPYAYQSSVNNIWNNFDDRFRDPAFTYPTVNGVIDTRQWEGFREGIDDVRYLTTLMKAIRQAKGTKPKLSAEAQQWVNNLNPQDDLDTLRAKIIQWIMKLI